MLSRSRRLAGDALFAGALLVSSFVLYMGARKIMGEAWRDFRGARDADWIGG